MRRIRLAVFLTLCAGICVALAIGRVHAEDRAAMRDAMRQTPSAAPTIQVYSRETIVDVTVTDKDGKPVHGLTKDDFTVKEDGKPQAIKSFAEFGRKEVEAPPKLPENVYTNLQPPAASGATNILWLDFTNAAPVLAAQCCEAPPSSPTTASTKPLVGPCNAPFEAWGSCDLARSMAWQKHTKQYAEEYLKKMPAGTRVAVFGTSYPGHLRVLQGVTSDPALLSAAVDTMPFDTDGMVMLAPRTVPEEGAPEDWCAQQERRNRMTLESLAQMASDLAQIKGRKNLLWYNARIWTLTTPDRPACLSDPRQELQRVYGLLAAAQVTVFPISVRGVEGNDGPIAKPLDLVANDKAVDKLAMEAIAEATGGKAYYNSNDLGDLTAKAMRDGSDYYTLSYVPKGREYDGRHHTIKVVVADKPGLKLNYRDEYYAEDPRKMVATPGLTLAAVADSTGPIDMRTEMGRAMPTAQQLLFDVQVEPSTEVAKPGDPAVFGALEVKLKAKPLARYGFTYAFPGREIALKTAADGTQRGSLEFDLAAYDGDGNVVTSLRQGIDLNLTAEQAAQLAHSPFRYFQQLDLPAGALFVRVGVLDRAANKVGTLELPVTVAKTSTQRAAAAPGAATGTPAPAPSK